MFANDILYLCCSTDFIKNGQSLRQNNADALFVLTRYFTHSDNDKSFHSYNKFKNQILSYRFYFC